MINSGTSAHTHENDAFDLSLELSNGEEQNGSGKKTENLLKI